MAPIVIVGAGGFGREVFSLIEALRRQGGKWDVKGFVDDSPSPDNLERVRGLGSRILGPVNMLRHFEPIATVIAVGEATIRETLAGRLAGPGLRWPALIHPDSTVGRGNSVGAGAVIAAGARISTNVVVGTHVHIDQNVTVGHDTELRDFSRLNPQSCISGSVVIGRRALVGANATILPGLVVGDDSVVGAGAVVVRSVERGNVVAGVPATVLRLTPSQS